jgi:class 3 adenylate cyclase
VGTDVASEHGQRKIAAILIADVVGYSRLAGADEDRTLARLRALRSDLIDPAIAVHHGRIVKRTGDGSLIEFRSAGVDCALIDFGGFESEIVLVSRQPEGRNDRGPKASGNPRRRCRRLLPPDGQGRGGHRETCA